MPDQSKSRLALSEAASKRKPTNVSLPMDMLNAAKELGVNVSQASTDGLAVALKKERERRWLEENWEAIQKHNEWVEKNGLILADLQVLKL